MSARNHPFCPETVGALRTVVAISRQTDTHANPHPSSLNKYADMHTCRHADMQTCTQDRQDRLTAMTDRQTQTEADKQTDRQTEDRHTRRPTDRQADT